MDDTDNGLDEKLERLERILDRFDRFVERSESTARDNRIFAAVKAFVESIDVDRGDFDQIMEKLQPAQRIALMEIFCLVYQEERHAEEVKTVEDDRHTNLS